MTPYRERAPATPPAWFIDLIQEIERQQREWQAMPWWRRAYRRARDHALVTVPWQLAQIVEYARRKLGRSDWP